MLRSALTFVGRRSVRLKLLVLALLPIVVLMPLLLLVGMTRWTADYDKVLIANVESDLRIAEQHLQQIMASTATQIEALAGSIAYEDAVARGLEAVFIEQMRQELQLDFLIRLEGDALFEAAARWPVIADAMHGAQGSQIDIFGADDLAALPGRLDERAAIPLIPTEAAAPTDRTVEDRGMVVHSAAPIKGQDAALVGGILLNRNLDFIDTINALVYLNATTGGERQGTATLFLEDVRVSTNVRLFEDVRALGTRVSAAVRSDVLGEGRTWLDRAFVVNDWYISGYLPIRDSFGERVGMLYVGFLEEPFAQAKLRAYLTMLGVFAAVVAIATPLFLRMAKGIFAPLERMTHTMNEIERGNLGARNGETGSGDEIGQVASHLDSLLDQVQERDRKLRGWADELEGRVDQRTAELREANEKLESTYRQLVMSEKLASIGEITAGVAHEINNPVAVIQGNVDVMRQTLEGRAADVEEELSLIDQQIMRIGAIVGKLLQFARPSEFSPQGEQVDLAQCARDCLQLVGHAYAKDAIKVSLDLADVPPVSINQGELQQVIVNLVINAVQAMEGRGALELALREHDHEGESGAALIVRDTGPGIPEEQLTTIFDPFFTSKLGEGTGLGLSISQTIVQRAGGLITAANRSEGGAEITLWLPFSDMA